MRRTTLVGAGLFAAWAVHDLEELMTMQAGSRELASRAPSWVPIPEDVRRHGYSPEHLRIGIGIVGGVVAAAAVAGVRSEGRSPMFRTVLQGFGWHGLGHLAIAGLARGYVSGVATTPVVVLPYWLWARRELAREGAPLESSGAASLVAVPPVVLGAHALARLLTRKQRREAACSATPAGQA